MKPHRLAFAAAILLAGTAQAQFMEQTADPYLKPQKSTTQALFDKAYQPYPRAYGGNEAAGPNDKAFEGLFKRDPRLVGGYELFPNLAIEAGYVYLMNWGFHHVEPSPDEAPGGLNKNNFSSHLAVKYSLPLTDKLVAFGKVGVAHSVMTPSLNVVALHAARNPTTPARRTEQDTGRYLGVGAQYKLSENAAVDAQYGKHGDSASKWGEATNSTGMRANLKMGF
jgi:opacity protein-like surface antigen